MRSLLPDSVEELRPTGWEDQLQSANLLRPFSLKHARQQASIVGHMQRLGLAPSAAAPAAVAGSADDVRRPYIDLHRRPNTQRLCSRCQVCLLCASADLGKPALTCNRAFAWRRAAWLRHHCSSLPARP